MIKGARWFFIVLLIGAEEWISSSQSIQHRQTRQLPRRNVIYLQPLRNMQYLLPIPISFPPPFNDRTQSASGDSMPTASIQTRWIPVRSSSNEEQQPKQTQRNAYVPPIRPPMIVTRKPLKNTFDIPLTKSIQVSQARPNIQTTGYIRKNLVKVYATRTTTTQIPNLRLLASSVVTKTTTENPSLKSPGSLAESTVQTLLNYTPADDGWKPKSPTTSRPPVAPAFNSRKRLGSKVDKHRNYTGIRFGKVNSIMQTMPQSGAEVKVVKNETNFLMRFTPEDIKYTAVEVKIENVDSPFDVDSPEEFKDQRIYFDRLSNKENTNLHSEGNIPYQGHKTATKRPNESDSSRSVGSHENPKERRTIFDVFPRPEKPTTDSKTTQFLDQPPFSEKENPQSGSKRPHNNQIQKGGSYINEPSNVQRNKNKEIDGEPPNKNHKIYSIESSNTHSVANDKQINSNFPYGGLSKTVNKPSVSKEHVHGIVQQLSLPQQGQSPYFDTPSSKPLSSNKNAHDQSTYFKTVVFNKPVTSNNNRDKQQGQSPSFDTPSSKSVSSVENRNRYQGQSLYFENPSSNTESSSENGGRQQGQSQYSDSSSKKTVSSSENSDRQQEQSPHFDSPSSKSLSSNQSGHRHQGQSPYFDTSSSKAVSSNEERNKQRGNPSYFDSPSSKSLSSNENGDRQQGQSPYFDSPSSKSVSSNQSGHRHQGQSPYFDTPSNKIVSSNKNKDIQKISGHLYFDDPSKFNQNNFSTNYGVGTVYGKGKNYLHVNISPYGRAYNYDSLSNFFKNNRTQQKDVLTVAQIPLAVGIQYDISKTNPQKPQNIDLKLKKTTNNLENASKNNHNLDSPKSSLKLHSVTSASSEDRINVFQPQNNDVKSNDQVSKPAFEQSHKVNEAILRNPPRYLQFDDDYMKSAIRTNSEKNKDDADNLSTFTFSPRDRVEKSKNGQITEHITETENIKLSNIPSIFLSATRKPNPKVEYYEKTQLATNKPPLKEPADSDSFQPLFPEIIRKNPQDNLQQKNQNFGEIIVRDDPQANLKQRLQNYLETSAQSSDSSQNGKNRSPVSNESENANLIPIIIHDASKEKNKNLLYKSENGASVPKRINYSPEDTRRNINVIVSTGGGNNFPELITSSPVVTNKYDPEAGVVLDKKEENSHRPNRTENYVIQRKPSLIPESSGKARKPKITLSTGMLAGILIAALVFLGFLTGSMVYAFHQWKFSRSRAERQKKKKARAPGFPPEYLDEAFAGNTYIHNNIFLPTPQNMEERNPSDPDNSSMMGDEVVHEQPSTSSRARRPHSTFRGIRDE